MPRAERTPGKPPPDRWALLGLGAAAAAAAATLARSRRRTSSPEPAAPDHEEHHRDEHDGSPRPATRATRGAVAHSSLSLAVAEAPPRDVPPRAEHSLVEVLSQRLRLDRPVDDDAEAKASGQQVCEIQWWRGYFTSQFYVEADPPLDRLLESRMFRARGSDAPERSDSAVAAHEDLVEELVVAGWEPDGRGPHWFSDRFRRL